MFFLLPIQVRGSDDRDTVPLANALLIAANVMVYFLAGAGAGLAVGHGTGIFSIITYGFAHAGPAHLLANMWILWLFGNPVNRRLGNGWYLVAYLGTILALGLFARLFAGGPLLGSSGAIFAVLIIFCMLSPAAVVQIGYVALFPITLLAGLIWRPRHWLYWFVRWDSFPARAWVGLILVPLLEIWGLFVWGWNWTNLAHLFGVVCGLGVVLLLPSRITMGRSAPARAAY
jgi:membrane associated rhomboid family serine protease